MKSNNEKSLSQIEEYETEKLYLTNIRSDLNSELVVKKAKYFLKLFGNLTESELKKLVEEYDEKISDLESKIADLKKI
ncbi:MULTISPECIES: hypothetical protein [Acinetobacter]|uniref:hypothetical protein n=1 Tax=Acinetobacter TaxID=469 RepID=UPI00101EBCCB|nr:MULTISPECIES: hypothetical protein [Acinetobacter]MDM1757183.1 hypothetical protein [Acinetobacter sp. 256-1]MDM1760032.1 hypothetical protein [Acinetobacter sp. 251-1]RYL27202.1 hypothetical protein EWP19_07410 [Acinetobacter piscicola]